MDLTGQRFVRLLVLGPLERRGHNRYWLCRCDCGALRQIAQCNLSRQQSCGCKLREDTGNRFRLDGKTTRPLYGTWCGIKQRCLNPKNQSYPNYGGRGVGVSPDWADDYWAFEDWILEALGERPEGCTLDRVDNDGNYEPGNLRWATKLEQSNNARKVVGNARYDEMQDERDMWRDRALSLGWKS